MSKSLATICTFWPDISGKTKQQATLDWAAMPEFLRAKGGYRPVKKSCPLIKFATFGDLRSKEDSLRHDHNVLTVTGIEGDYDAKVVSPEEAVSRLERYQIRALVATTFQHQPDAPRWRVFAPLSKPVTPAERLRFVEALNGALGGILANESATLSQSYFIGWPPGVEQLVLSTFDDAEDGPFLDEIDHLDELRAPFPTTEGTTKPEGEKRSQAELLAELLKGDDVHANALRIVGRYVQQGMDDASIRQMFQLLAKEIASVRGQARADELVGGELERMIAGARGKGYAPPPPVQTANTTITAAELMNKEFADLKWCVPDVLPEGTYLLSAKPKVGKSWLALQIALAVATAGHTLGKRVQGGSALALCLEDNERRIKSRLEKLGAFFLPNADHLARLHLETKWPRVDQGGAAAIEDWLIAHPDARIVVVDTLQKVRPPTGGNKSAYEQDYMALAPLKDLSDRYNITVIVVHHNRKMGADDPLELISGTMGLSGGCDGALVIDRPRGMDDATLHLIGRDIEKDGEFAIRFLRDNCHWQMLGGAEEITASNERAAILKIFKEEQRGLSAKEVVELSGRKAPTARRLLRAMLEAARSSKY